MARNRMIKATFWSSKTLMRVSREARLFFIGLWNFADDYGVLDDSNRKILGEVFPYDETVTEKEIAKWKEELLREKLLIKSSYHGRDYLIIRSWEEHQKVAHPGKETIPARDLQEILVRASGEAQPQIEREKEIKKEREVENYSSENSDEEKNFEEDSDEIFLASLLRELILQNNPKAKKPNLQKWAAEVDKMIRIDCRTFKEIEFIIHWSQKDNFWKANILSTAKLREKFDQLFIKAKSEWEKQKEKKEKEHIPNFDNPYAQN
jgi:hypothetical protein